MRPRAVYIRSDATHETNKRNVAGLREAESYWLWQDSCDSNGHTYVLEDIMTIEILIDKTRILCVRGTKFFNMTMSIQEVLNLNWAMLKSVL